MVYGAVPRRFGIVHGDAYHSRSFWETSSGAKTKKEMVPGETFRRIRASHHVHQRDRMRETKRRDGKRREAGSCAEG